MLVTFQSKRQFRFSDTNASGQLHLDAYIRMMEETEYAFLRSRGLRVVLHDGKGIIGFPRLSAEVNVAHPLCFGDDAETTLNLTELSGKKIIYQFEIHRDNLLIATGKFEVACCRFPDGENPYAILIPEFVSEKLYDDPVTDADA